MLSDVRFAATLAGSRSARFGAQRIRHDLRKSGVSDELLQSTVDALKHTELARAQALWSKKFASPAADAAGRARQMRFLAGRGFSAEVIQRVVRVGCADDHDGQDAE
jgi:regulatory protein